MISFLFAEDYDSINYSIDSGISSSIIGCITIFMVHRIDSFINKALVKKLKSSFLIKFLISLFSVTILFFFISFILNIVVRDNYSISFSFIKEQIIIVNYILLLILSYYAIAFFTRKVAQKNKELKADNLEMSLALNKYSQRLPSVINKKTKLISVDEILFFKIEEGIVFAYVSNNKKCALSETTLNTLESKINPSVFFRINRSEIVHIDKIDSYEPYFKDRLAIKLSDKKTILYTSNAKSASFKKWLVNPANF